MQRVLSTDLWTEVQKQARASKSRKAAIAYVTRDLVGFREGDTLVVNASTGTIANGGTDAPLLRELNKKGVLLYACADLHAKTLLLDGVAIIGSGNMSASSTGLVEAALMSDHGNVVAGVASLIEQLVKQSSRLDERQIAQLCTIKVIRRGGSGGARPKRRKTRISKFGERTWIAGVGKLERDPTPEQQKQIDRAIRSLQKRVGSEDEQFAHIDWDVRDRFARECQKGDVLIQVWNWRSKAKPAVVYRAVPVLLKQVTNHWTRFYVSDPIGRAAELKWGQFQRLLREIGYARKVNATSVHEVDADVADAISRKWKSAARD